MVLICTFSSSGPTSTVRDPIAQYSHLCYLFIIYKRTGQYISTSCFPITVASILILSRLCDLMIPYIFSHFFIIQYCRANFKIMLIFLICNKSIRNTLIFVMEKEKKTFWDSISSPCYSACSLIGWLLVLEHSIWNENPDRDLFLNLKKIVIWPS